MAFGIGSDDFEFARAPVMCYSSHGTPYTRWLRYGMPKVPAVILDCTFYLFPTEEEARRGGKVGGTGFFVGVPSSTDPTSSYVYAVTNHHVLTGGSSVIRVNRKDGGAEVFVTDPSDWTFNPGADDVAVFQLSFGDAFKQSFLSTRFFATEADVQELGIGPGDDVFMVGRFVDHDGGGTNAPAVRFGHISVNPTLMQDALGHKSLSYILDVHSRSGYSGSPVFFYRTPGADLSFVVDGKPLNIGSAYVRFLGIHYSQFPEEWELKQSGSDKLATQAAPLVLDEKKHVVVGMSGMTCAVPAWRIMELLNRPELVANRKRADARAEASRPVTTLPIPEVASEASTHREDFNNLLDAAVRGRP